MIEDFYKFPTTPHLAFLEQIDIRNGKIMTGTERENFLQNNLVIEEKMDGACLGISFDRHGNLQAQNRGAYLSLPSNGQWKKLLDWLNMRVDLLFEALADRYILFGEWCYAKHSVFYDSLPDWFIAFDIYDKLEGRFFSCARRDVLLQKLDLAIIPRLGQGRYEFDDLESFFVQSQFGEGKAEGIYLRHNSRDWLEGRAKLVNPHFVQSINKHWSQGNLQMNRLQAMTRIELRR